MMEIWDNDAGQRKERDWTSSRDSGVIVECVYYVPL